MERYVNREKKEKRSFQMQKNKKGEDISAF
jgi:hypothetical protein